MKAKESKIKKIFIPVNEWRKFHPIGLVCASDRYYTNLASQIATLVKSKLGDASDLTTEDYKYIGFAIAAYLEDKVTGLNMWNAFISLYRKKIGNDYPFYDIENEEMYDNEPNFSDIRFLVWYETDRGREDCLINPLNPIIESLARDIYDLVVEEYESAPDSPELYDAIFDTSQYDDPLKVREMCMFINSRSYLFATNNIEENFDEISRVIEVFGDTIDEFKKIYFITSYLSFNVSTGPLNLLPWEWLAEMMELSGDSERQKIAKRLREMKSYMLMPYLIEKDSKKGLEVESVFGKHLTISYDMLLKDNTPDVQERSVIFASLFYYNGEWNINGMSSFTEKGGYDDYREEFIKRKESQKLAFKYNLNKNGDSRIGVVADFSELKIIMGTENTPHNTSAEMKKRMEEDKDLLYFINEDDGSISIVPDGAKAVKLPGNKYYDVEYATKEAALLILGDEASEELRKYLIDNHLIPDARLSGNYTDEFAKAWFARNAAFLNLYRHTDKVHFEIPESE